MGKRAGRRENTLMQLTQRFGEAPLMHWVARLYTRIFGWKVVGLENLPDDPKMIGVLAPHTSNWDVWMMYVMAYEMRITANWLAKDSLLRPPLGWLLRMLGAIPIDRSKSNNYVDQVVDVLHSYDNLYLAIAPEGTRSKTERWRSGFYYIAMKANVRLILMFIDYGTKEVGFGPVVTPTGDIHKDFEAIKAFYADITPRNPEQRSDMVLRIPARAEQAEADKAPDVSAKA